MKDEVGVVDVEGRCDGECSDTTLCVRICVYEYKRRVEV